MNRNLKHLVQSKHLLNVNLQHYEGKGILYPMYHHHLVINHLPSTLLQKAFSVDKAILPKEKNMSVF